VRLRGVRLAGVVAEVMIPPVLPPA